MGRVLDQVDAHLLDPTRVDLDRRQVLRARDPEVDSLEQRLCPHAPRHHRQEIRRPVEAEVDRVRAAQVEQLAHQRTDAQGLVAGPLRHLTALRRQLLVPKGHLGVAQNRRDRIPDFVRHPGGEVPHRREAFPTRERLVSSREGRVFAGQGVRHLIEVGCEIAELVRVVGRDPGAEIARGDAPCPRRQRPKREHDPPPEEVSAERDEDGRRDEQDPGARPEQRHELSHQLLALRDTAQKASLARRPREPDDQDDVAQRNAPSLDDLGGPACGLEQRRELLSASRRGGSESELPALFVEHAELPPHRGQSLRARHRRQVGQTVGFAGQPLDEPRTHA